MALRQCQEREAVGITAPTYICFVSSMEVSLKYAVGPVGRCIRVMASARTIRSGMLLSPSTGERTRLFHVLVNDTHMLVPPSSGPSRYPSKLEPLAFLSPYELGTWKHAYDFVAKVVRCLGRFGRGRNEDFRWDRRVVSGRKVISKGVVGDVRRGFSRCCRA